jgi:MtN3 and saliva related transmembrane protein
MYRCLMASFDVVLAWLVSVVGIATGAAYVPQVLRLWKRRTSDDVSVLTYLLFMGGQVIYLVYGVRIHQWPLIIGMAANLAGSIGVVASALHFRGSAGRPAA